MFIKSYYFGDFITIDDFKQQVEMSFLLIMMAMAILPKKELTESG